MASLQLQLLLVSAVSRSEGKYVEAANITAISKLVFIAQSVVLLLKRNRKKKKLGTSEFRIILKHRKRTICAL